MIAILTGDVMQSGDFDTKAWLPPLKNFLSQYGTTPNDWEIYRGDEFQLRTTPERALKTTILIKAMFRSVKGLDVRLALGLGTEEYRDERVSQSNGLAYQRSGRTFEKLKKERVSLAINSGDERKDEGFNLVLRLGLEFMDHWSPVSAEIISLVLQEPGLAQREIAERLSIQQSAVSQRLKRARRDLVADILAHYKKEYLIH